MKVQKNAMSIWRIASLSLVLMMVVLPTYADDIVWFFGLTEAELQDFLDNEYHGVALRDMTMNEAFFDFSSIDPDVDPPMIEYGYDFSDDTVWSISRTIIKRISGQKIGKQVVKYIQNNPSDFDDLVVTIDGDDVEVSSWFSPMSFIKNNLVNDWFEHASVNIDSELTEDVIPELRELFNRAVDLYLGTAPPVKYQAMLTSTWAEQKTMRQ